MCSEQSTSLAPLSLVKLGLLLEQETAQRGQSLTEACRRGAHSDCAHPRTSQRLRCREMLQQCETASLSRDKLATVGAQQSTVAHRSKQPFARRKIPACCCCSSRHSVLSVRKRQLRATSRTLVARSQRLGSVTDSGRAAAQVARRLQRCTL